MCYKAEDALCSETKLHPPRLAESRYWDHVNRMGVSPGSDPHYIRELFESSCFVFSTVSRIFFARSWMLVLRKYS